MSSTMSSPAPSSAAGVASRPTVLLLIGPPGCGKGTQAERLKECFGIPAISTGEMIRAEIASGTSLGKLAQGITITGGLLGDDLINKMIESRLNQPDCTRGFLLDGYPRSVPQAEFLVDLLARIGYPEPSVVHLDVPYSQLVDRTCMRRFCPACGHIYNLKSHPPKAEGACDHCQATLQQRGDDCEETVKSRLQAYDKTTAPVLAYFRNKDYHRVDASGSPGEVFARVAAELHLDPHE